MKTSDIDNIWKDAKSHHPENTFFSKEEIDKFRYTRSGQIFGNIRKTIWISVVTNAIILLILIIFATKPLGQDNLILTVAGLIICTLGLIIYQLFILRRVRRLENFSEIILTRFNELKSFFKGQFPLFQIISSLSNPILVTTGVFYYLFMKYSEVRFSDTDDVIVMAVLVLFSYLIAYIGSRIGSANLRREIDDLLSDDIYDEEYLVMIIARERRLKRRKLLLMTTIAVIGILLLALIIILNYTSGL